MTPDPIDGGSRVCVQTDASDALATMSTSPATAFGEGVRRLRARLGRPLPGRDAVKDVAPSAHTVLTVRSAALRDHAGQISLPGGRIEAGESPVDAALREAWEELAIGPADLDVLGVLTPIYVPPSHFLVHPVVAARRSRPDLRPHAAEVAEAIEVPIARFLDDAVRRVEIWDIRGERRRVPFFDLEGHKVWGATAMILREFAVVWREAVL